MGFWVRGAGEVGAEEFHSAGFLVLDDPHESGTEHGVGRLDDLGAEGVV